MANLRHYYITPEWKGKVAVFAIDDLEKMPLDQMAYNGLKLQGLDSPHLAPTSNYSNGRKLVFTSILLLSLETAANKQREEGKAPKLKRYPNSATSLPLAALQEATAAGGELPKTVDIATTDRSGLPFVVVKAYGKKNGKHEAWSQPASSLQQVDDLLLLLCQLKKEDDWTTKSHEHLFAKADLEAIQRGEEVDAHAVPWIILTSDGASDQSVQNLMTVLALWELLVILDLDGIEKWHYCPGHSKEDPAEMLNRTTKTQFRGQLIASTPGDASASMDAAKETAAKHLRHTTHAGEEIYVAVQPRQGVQQDDRKEFEASFTYEELKEFSKVRSYWRPWINKDVPDAKVEEWENDEEHPEKSDFARLEKNLRLAKAHRRHHSLYGIVITKCSKEDAPNCSYCKDHPLRGEKNWYEQRRDTANINCSAALCQKKPCKHMLNATFLDLLKQLVGITPIDGRTPRHCSGCGQTDHNCRSCPQKDDGSDGE